MWFQTLPYDSEAPKMDFKEGVLILSGYCIPEDPDETLKDLFNEIENYLKQDNNLTIMFKFDAVNTSSSAKFSQLFTKLNGIKAIDYLTKSKRQIKLIWCYPIIDEDMKELGMFYKKYSDKLSKKGAYDSIEFKLKSYRYE